MMQNYGTGISAKTGSSGIINKGKLVQRTPLEKGNEKRKPSVVETSEGGVELLGKQSNHLIADIHKIYEHILRTEGK